MLLNVSLLGFILAIIISVFSSLRKSRSVFLAAYFILINLFSLIYFTIFENESPRLAAIFAVHFTPFYFLTKPFLHLYIISHRKDFSFKPRYILLFVPFLIILINITPYLLIPFSHKLIFAKEILRNPTTLNEVKLLFLPYFYQSILRPIFNLLLLLYTFYTFYVERNSLEFLPAKFSQKNFIYIILIISLILNSLSFFIGINSLAIEAFGVALVSAISYVTVNSIVNFLTAAHNIFVLFFPQILFRELFSANKYLLRKKDQSLLEDTTISKDRLLEIDQLLLEYIQDKPYLTKGFTLTFITRNTGIPVHQLSIYFNDYLKISFNDWKNKLRIDYAVDEIKAGKLALYTIESIALKSGFSSRSNFNSSFISIMKQTPSEFIKGLKE
jgi:AraC-like DNA-binding protein